MKDAAPLPRSLKDAVALLKQDHRKVEDLFEKFEKAGENAMKKKLDLCRRIAEKDPNDLQVRLDAFTFAARAGDCVTNIKLQPLILRVSAYRTYMLPFPGAEVVCVVDGRSPVVARPLRSLDEHYWGIAQLNGPAQLQFFAAVIIGCGDTLTL